MLYGRWIGRYCKNYYGNNIKLQCIYEEIANQQLIIMLSKPLPPESDYLDLIDAISEIDGVGSCFVEHRYKLVCGVNFWQFNTDEIIKTIGDILDVFFSHQKEKR